MSRKKHGLTKPTHGRQSHPREFRLGYERQKRLERATLLQGLLTEIRRADHSVSRLYASLLAKVLIEDDPDLKRLFAVEFMLTGVPCD